jgi:hypothetical protein
MLPFGTTAAPEKGKAFSGKKPEKATHLLQGSFSCTSGHHANHDKARLFKLGPDGGDPLYFGRIVFH